MAAAAVGTASAVVATTAIAPATARGMLHARAKIVANASLKGLLFLSGGAHIGNRQAIVDRRDSGLRFQRVFGFFEGFDRLVRFRFARPLACVAALFVARGCYSSIAPTAKIDPGIDDSGLPPVPPSAGDACAPRRPWEGPGVTGVIPNGASSARLPGAAWTCATATRR